MNVKTILNEFIERQGVKSAEWCKLLDQIDKYLHKLEYQLSQSVPVESSMAQYCEIEELKNENAKLTQLASFYKQHLDEAIHIIKDFSEPKNTKGWEEFDNKIKDFFNELKTNKYLSE